MNYIEVYFELNPLQPASEILVAELTMIGFESFVEEANGLKAYIPINDFNKNLMDRLQIFKNPEFTISYMVSEIEDQNWNAKWEKEYEPVLVDNRCYIRAPFHQHRPEIDYEIIIKPQMSFGTAHHETTYQMIQYLLNEDVTDKSVLDLGTGTGILAILAQLKGAIKIDAIDNNEWAYKNACENVMKNKADKVNVLSGEIEIINNSQYDLILANINKNILINNMAYMARASKKGTPVIVSGFYKNDLQELVNVALIHGLHYTKHSESNNWIVARFQSDT
jgi:ribosomal protein L11 methyltransferase